MLEDAVPAAELPDDGGCIEVPSAHLEDWLVGALEPVLSKVAELSNHSALLDHLSCENKRIVARSTLMLGRYLDITGDEPALLAEAKKRQDEVIAAMDGDYRTYDRRRDKRMWSHERFERHVLARSPGEIS